MSHKFIPYPCDYKYTASVRSAHRRGNAFVIVLCGLIVLLLGAGAVFALINDGRGWKTAAEVVKHIYVTDHSIEYAKIGEPQEQAVAPLPDPGKTQTDPSADPNAAILNGVNSIPDVVDEVSPGVVGILNYQRGKKKNAEPEPVGSGSGFILSEDGYVVTNHHVIEGADRITVTLKSGETCEATLVGGDVMTDVAVLKIDAKGLKALSIGDSSKMRVGEFVLAIGDPISADELSGSVTFGIISALSREINIEGFVNEYLQTDAAVNPGNSGGPLINMRGEVIGVTSAKYTTAGYDELGQSISSEGIGFALPINNVMEIVRSLIENGSTVRPGIGVSVVTYGEDSGKTPGVYIYTISENGPADEAGAKVGDRLLKVDGVALETQDAFVEAVRNKKPGDELKLLVDRNGQEIELTIVVGDLNTIHK